MERDLLTPFVIGGRRGFHYTLAKLDVPQREVVMLAKHAVMGQLLAEGVQYVFGNPGSTEVAFMDALQDYPQLKYVLSLQETSAVAMADGYARATGKPAVANVHIAPGLANALSMIFNSW